MKRMWINQPSRHDVLHHLHGTKVLAEEVIGRVTRVWFTSGPTISMEIPVNCLSKGWIKP